MKKVYLFILLIVLLSGCYDKSYYEVSNINQQRFGGWELENAQFLNESYDLILLVDDMSTLAQNRSKLTENYLLAKEASKDAKSLNSNYKMEALRLRIKLTSELSKTNNDEYRKLEDFPDDNFDIMYVQYMKEKLAELDLKMKAYTATGQSERLVQLADEVQDKFRSLNLDLGQIL